MLGGGGILIAREYLPVTAYVPMYVFWSILGIYSCVLLQCNILIKRNTKFNFPLQWHYYKMLLRTSPIHMWTVTQDALVRECEVYCTTALTSQPFLEGESVLFHFSISTENGLVHFSFSIQNRQPAFLRGIPFEISHDSNLMYRAYSHKRF